MYRSLTTHRHQRAFTLIELLVVIAIIALLAAILFPVFARARENARRTSCLSNAKQIGLGVMQYSQDYDEKLPMYVTGGLSWTWQIQPYVKSTQLFRCPSAQKISTGVSSICDPRNQPAAPPSAMGGYGLNFEYLGNTTPVSLAAIEESAKTVFTAESTGMITTTVTYRPSIWAVTGPTTCNTPAPTYRDNMATWHFDGNNILFCDGHAKWLKLDTIQDYDGNGTVDNGWYCTNKTSCT